MTGARYRPIVFYFNYEIKYILRTPWLWLGCLWVMLFTGMVLMQQNGFSVWESLYISLGHPMIASMALLPFGILMTSLISESISLRESRARIGHKRLFAGYVSLAAIMSFICLALQCLFVISLSIVRGQVFAYAWSNLAYAMANAQKQTGGVMLPLLPINEMIIRDFTPFQAFACSWLLLFALLLFYWLISFLFSYQYGRRKSGGLIVYGLHVLGYIAIQTTMPLSMVIPLGHFFLCYRDPWSYLPYATLAETLLMFFCYLTIGAILYRYSHYENYAKVL